MVSLSVFTATECVFKATDQQEEIHEPQLVHEPQIHRETHPNNLDK